MKPKLFTEGEFYDAVTNGAKVSVRWRKASASWAIYVSGVVYMSGFESAKGCAEWIKNKWPFAVDCVDYSRA